MRAGQPVYQGTILAGGQAWTLPASGLAPGSYDQTHVLAGAQLDGGLGNGWHGEAIGSRYDFQHDIQRNASAFSATNAQGGAGTLADLGGSRWSTFDLRSNGPLGDDNSLYAGVHFDR